MPALVIVGTQWGDEGKGKIVDFLAGRADVVVRFQGGNNAGHTIVHGDEEFMLHLVPSGVVRGRTGVIGNGVVIDLDVLHEELDMLRSRGLEPDLRISDCAHVILPFHRILDGALDSSAGIGTTKRGIGPAYSDKAWRIGIRIADLFSSDLESKVERNRAVKAALLDGLGLEADLPTTAEVTEALRRRAGEIRDMVTDTSRFLVESLESDRWVLFEGAQGILLDVDFGTYPFVTSSSTGVGGASIGTGVPVRHLQRVLGVVKAYQTRVGEGPMPTEISRPLAERLRVKGGEYGVTTGRPRRCGFLDLVALRHAIRVSGITSIALTKADVLCGLDSVNVAKAYMINGKHHTTPPADPAMLARAEPVYDEFPAWDEIDRDSVRREGYEAFPQELKEYVQYIERSTDTCVNIISYGPKRDETVVLRDPWGS